MKLFDYNGLIIKISILVTLGYFAFVTTIYVKSEYTAFQIINRDKDSLINSILAEKYILTDTLVTIMDFKFVNNEFEKSYNIANRILQTDKSSPQPYYVISIYNNKQGKNKSAITYIKKALELDPNNSRYLITAGLLEYLNENDSNARLFLNKTKLINPNQEGVSALENLLNTRK